MQHALNGRGEVTLVRRAGIIPDRDGLAIPGGESTTLSKLIAQTNIEDEIKKAAAAGIPILATFAGMVLVSRKIQGDAKVKSLSLTDTTMAETSSVLRRIPSSRS